ncbi:MAG: aspartate carbamoyltransferase [Clostridia bacterium]|nr:aspartate carbamoyltransferase [Clostridia bacterium]
MKHLLDPMDLTTEEIDRILELADQMIADPDAYAELCRRKKLATLFFEPSTRTRLSFEAAMLELGGDVIGFAGADNSSAAKGESVLDTVRTVENYADIIAMRHPKEGAAKAASMKAHVPLINAGDGGHQHPTQTLTDLMTIHALKGRLGDLKFGRTVHSLIRAMTRYPGNRFIFISPKELKVPRYVKEDVLRSEGSRGYKQFEELDKTIGDLDILYMTRVQAERFFNEEDYIRLRDSYVLNKEKLKKAKDDMIIMHPLPRVNEIAAEVDDDPRAVYFEQVRYGKYVRMALIAKMLGVA